MTGMGEGCRSESSAGTIVYSQSLAVRGWHEATSWLSCVRRRTAASSGPSMPNETASGNLACITLKRKPSAQRSNRVTVLSPMSVGVTTLLSVVHWCWLIYCRGVSGLCRDSAECESGCVREAKLKAEQPNFTATSDSAILRRRKSAS
jgi:hypothetical protein